MIRQKTYKISFSIPCRGFTLIEAMFAIMIIGLGIAALMTVFGAGTQANGYGDTLSKAVYLAGEIRSMTDDVAYTNLLSYNGKTWQGVDANGSPVAGLQDYQQTLTVTAVNPDDLTTYIGPDPQALLLTAVISRNSQEVSRLRWLRSQ